MDAQPALNNAVLLSNSALPANIAPLAGHAMSPGSSTEFPSTALLALIAQLETRIRALVSDNRRLRLHLRQLTVALDDSLDRESAHALCPHHERLVPSRTSSTQPAQTNP